MPTPIEKNCCSFELNHNETHGISIASTKEDASQFSSFVNNYGSKQYATVLPEVFGIRKSTESDLLKKISSISNNFNTVKNDLAKEIDNKLVAGDNEGLIKVFSKIGLEELRQTLYVKAVSKIAGGLDQITRLQ